MAGVGWIRGVVTVYLISCKPWAINGHDVDAVLSRLTAKNGCAWMCGFREGETRPGGEGSLGLGI